jgi:hypothetical protein
MCGKLCICFSVNLNELQWNSIMTVDCWLQFCVLWLPTEVVVGVTASHNKVQCRQFVCVCV